MVDNTGYTDEYEAAFKYIEEHQEVEDVLISGGDPLVLSDEKIEAILIRLERINHIKIIRIGTKAPVVNPSRVTTLLTNRLARHYPIYMNLHFTHPDEITPEVRAAVQRLGRAGVIMGSQTVILKDVNDNAETLKKLFMGLTEIGVRPYYAYVPDLVPHTAYFRNKVDYIVKIFEYLQGNISGLAIPKLILDLPNGGGKIPLYPNYFVRQEGNVLTYKNFKGIEYQYTEPV
jgi:lysine 2,3-aminomutase